MASSSEISPSSIIDDSQQPFQDAIHKLMNFSRPLIAEQKTELGQLLSELVALCGSDSSRWRTLLLTLTHKRYHQLSPTFREEALATGQKNLVAGEGERLVFYSSFCFLFEGVVDESTTTHDASKLLLAALETMLKIAPHAGGSRDICHLLVDMIEVVLAKSGTVNRAKKLQIAVKGHVSLPSLVGQCIQAIEKSCEHDGIVSTLLGGLLQLAANTLDNDFEIIQRTTDKTEQEQERKFPSTLHVFIPHRDRGRSKKPKGDDHRRFSERQLLNSVAEILIWSRTQKASTIPAFAESHRRLLLEGSSRTSNKQELTNLQTVVRILRKSLNSYARDQGFMLSTQFAMKDSPKLSSRQVNGGKAGDLACLTRLATKKSDATVLKLIQLRAAVGKTTKFSSVREALVVPTVTENGTVEIEAIERDIYLERLRATLVYLRSVVKSHDKSVVVASMDKCDLGHALAVLVVAAMSSWALSETDSDPAPAKTTAKLLIAGVQKDMSCMQDVVDLLRSISTGLEKNELDVPSFMASDGAATTKAVMNTIDRHVQDSEVFLLVTGADINLPSDYMKALSDRGCSMHCHDSDDTGARLQRELARKGDITVSLSWNTKDDLDLHVFVPGGEEIWYSHKLSKDGMCGLDVDMNAGGGQSNEPVENVFLGDLDNKKQAPLGQYKVVVQNYAYHASPPGSEVPFLIIVEKNGKKEKYAGHCKGTGKSSDVVVCEFTYAGRSVPLPGDEKETAFKSSNMVNMTASTGQTLESLGQLVQVAQQHEQIAAVRPLLAEEEESEEQMLEGGVEVPGTLEVTSQDLLNIILAKLPAKFHQIVGEAFGGPSLAEACSESIARRMVADRIPIAELKRNGFPDDIVQAVKVKMATIDV